GIPERIVAQCRRYGHPAFSKTAPRQPPLHYSLTKEAASMSEAAEELEDKVSPNGSDDEGRSRLSGLGGKSVLFPVAAAAASAAAAGLAAKKGPDLMKKLQGEASEEGEEIGKKGLQ